VIWTRKRKRKRKRWRHTGIVYVYVCVHVWVLGVLVACAPRGPASQVPTGADVAPSAAVRADIERAEDAERARRHDEARAAYERAIADAHDPLSADIARREYAETLETWGELDTAVTQLEAAVAVKHDDPAAWNDLGVLYHHRGDDARALTALETAKQLAPADWRPRRQLAALLMALHEYDRAAAEYRAMLDLPLPDRLRDAVHRALELLAQAAASPAS
jgi:tetratricopeptide (TPR) repeat protein